MTAPLQPTVPFVELLGRSNFSFLRGASHPEEMVIRARELAYRGFALCDLDGLYGVVRADRAIHSPSLFTTEALVALPTDFKFHVGTELSLNDGSTIALLPMNKEGYHHLCQLITKSKRNSPKTFSRLQPHDFENHHQDLIALPLPPWNAEKLQLLKNFFEDRLYLPVWKDLSWQSLQFYNEALRFEQDLRIPIVATQRPFMHCPERKPLFDVLTCTLHHCTLDEAQTRLLQNAERFLHPLPHLLNIWSERPDALARTCEISRRLNFTLQEIKYEYPKIQLPAGLTATDYLRELAEEGLKRRYPQGISAEARKTVEHELRLIEELNYENYFLTLWEICQFALERGILHQGRGSAANSIVCYALGLTAVDPLNFQLLFERFISKERREPPDIDIDFESGRREEVIQHIYRKYGERHAAMVCTVICYRSRLALRETAKVLGLDAELVQKIVRFMGREGLSRLIENPEKAAEWGLSGSRWQLLIMLTRQLIGFPRHIGIHTGGFVLSQRPIDESVPVESATMENRYVVQWNKDDLAYLEMMKIDVLGLGMLSALNEIFNLLRRHEKKNFNLYNIPANDAPTYRMIQQADTIGTFQIESRAQMSLLPRLKPKNFYDLVVEVAIVRPGPLQGGMVHPYIRRRNGQDKVHYPHPKLHPILEKTFGVPIFQEQIMQIATTVCGFTAGESNELRRIMSTSWQNHGQMEGLRLRLMNGMIANNIEKKYAEQIYQTIVGFASYGFPESHAASFAHLTYASCYLKWNHPEFFLCGLLNSQPMGFYSPRSLIADAQRHGVRLLPLDIQRSEYDYSLEQQECGSWWVRCGLRSLLGLQPQQLRLLVEERRRGGKFTGLQDLVERVGLERRALIKLAASGALSSLAGSPREALWKVCSLELNPQSLVHGKSREKLDGADANLALIPIENNFEKLEREYQLQGFSLTEHPIALIRPTLEKWWRTQDNFTKNGLPMIRAEDLKKYQNGKVLVIAGLMSIFQRPPTAKGFTFITGEDETGLFNVVLTDDVYQKYRMRLINHPLLLFWGRLQNSQGVINLKTERISPLSTLNFLKPQNATQYHRSM